MADNQVFLNSAEEEAYNRSHPDPNRGTILPFRKDEEGLHFGLPQWMIDAYNAIKLPADVIKKGYEPTSEDVANFALTVGTSGLSASSVTDVPDNALGMFLGQKAQNADKKALAKAMSMESQGSSREDIWDNTGWWKKPDGNWAFEISDDLAGLSRDARREFTFEDMSRGATTDVLDHPELFNNYNDFGSGDDLLNPDKKDKVSITHLEKDENDELGSGNYSKPWTNKLFSTGERINSKATNEDVLRKVLLHEVQHAVQEREGWTKGTNPDTTGSILQDIFKNMPENWHKRNKLYKEQDANMELVEELERKLNYEEDVDVNSLEETLDDLITRNQELQVEIDSFSDSLKDVDAWSQSMIDKYGGSAYPLYRANEGEAIASITANRANMTPEQRKANPPWLHFGDKDNTVPFERIPEENSIWFKLEDIVPERLRNGN